MDQPKPLSEDRLARFTELLSTCQSHLLASVYAMVQNMADAEDIFQRASLILWRKFDDYREGTDFRAWAVTVTRYEALNFIRKRRGDRLFFSEAVLQALSDTQDELAVDAETQEVRWLRLANCVGRLPRNQKKMVELYYGGALSAAAIAKSLDSTEGAIRTALCRVRQTLRKCVQSGLKESMA